MNLSRRCPIDREFPDQVARLLAVGGVRSDRVVPGITETLKLSQLEVVEDVLCRFRALSIRLSVDDFGTGYSSMSFFQRVKVDAVKIDGSFIRAISVAPAAAAIMNSIIALGHGGGLPVVADGIETDAQLDAATTSGCDVGQGYHLGRPLPAAALAERLATAGV